MPIVSTVIAMLNVRLMSLIIILIHANTSEIRPRTRLVMINNNDIVTDAVYGGSTLIVRCITHSRVNIANYSAIFRRERGGRRYLREIAVSPGGFAKVLSLNVPRPIKLSLHTAQDVMKRKLYIRRTRSIARTIFDSIYPFSIYCKMSHHCLIKTSICDE